ncbi:peptidase S8/S53 domain-containing protein [Colletotrichum cereale]|nr:peptidase S8/S53 domain-containing protein [Colletotrichum cereale]
MDQAGSQHRQLLPSHDLHEKISQHWNKSWTKRDRLKDDITIPVQIGLKQFNIEKGATKLMDLADPSSPNFGRHMSEDEVLSFFAPPQSIVDAISEWVTLSGIPRSWIQQSRNKQWIQFNANVSVVENLFHTKYYIYEHHSTQSRVFACPGYYIPPELASHIDYVKPGVHLIVRSSRLSITSRSTSIYKRGNPSPDNAGTCDRYVTPQCIADRYRIPRGIREMKGNELGIVETAGSHYQPVELDTYYSTMFPDIPNGTRPLEKLINGATGAYDPFASADQGSLEANLDFQSSWPIIWPQKTVLYQVDDEYYERQQMRPNSSIKGFLNTFYDAIDGGYCSYPAFGQDGDCTDAECQDPKYPNPINKTYQTYQGKRQCGIYKPTNVISISYSLGESSLPASYFRRQCNEIMKLALQGITILVASGDDGVGPWKENATDTCSSNEVFTPNFAATCPYALAVGGTELNYITAHNGTRILTESSPRFYASGGGFSNLFKRPDYQAEAVEHYLQTTPPPFQGYTTLNDTTPKEGTGLYHINGRAYPDVSIVGDWFPFRQNGTWTMGAGTSLATPIMASVLNRINEERLAVGKSTIGFVQPVLYQHPEVFFDVTNGSNPNSCGNPGFKAAEGWDPVSGLGSVYISSRFTNCAVVLINHTGPRFIPSC